MPNSSDGRRERGRARRQSRPLPTTRRAVDPRRAAGAAAALMAPPPRSRSAMASGVGWLVGERDAGVTRERPSHVCASPSRAASHRERRPPRWPRIVGTRSPRTSNRAGLARPQPPTPGACMTGRRCGSESRRFFSCPPCGCLSLLPSRALRGLALARGWVGKLRTRNINK
jgi:hypothetical protein